RDAPVHVELPDKRRRGVALQLGDQRIDLLEVSEVADIERGNERPEALSRRQCAGHLLAALRRAHLLAREIQASDPLQIVTQRIVRIQVWVRIIWIRVISVDEWWRAGIAQDPANRLRGDNLAIDGVGHADVRIGTTFSGGGLTIERRRAVHFSSAWRISA